MRERERDGYILTEREREREEYIYTVHIEKKGQRKGERGKAESSE